MSSSPEQSNPGNSSMNMSRGHSEASMISVSGGESPPRSNHGNQTLSPPQMMNLMGPSASSHPGSPQISSRLSSGSLSSKKGMKKKFLRKPTGTMTPQHPPTVHEDPLDAPDNHARFVRMLKQIQPKKIRSFKRTKRRADKYHSDDGYTSDPGIIREEDDDETDNDHDASMQLRRLSQIREVERKLEKARRTLPDDDDVSSINDNEDFVDGIVFKPSNRRTLRFNRGQLKRRKVEKLEAQLKDLHEGGPLDTRGARLRGRIEGGIRGIGLIKGKLTHAGSRLRRKWITGTAQDEEAIDDDDDENYHDDDITRSNEDVVEHNTFTSEQEEIISLLRVDFEALREECAEQSKKLKEELIQQIKRLGESILEKLEQERERGDRLESQLNDITELHQHEVGELHDQLTQIEHTTTNKCQDLEDGVEAFQSKFDQLDIHVHKLMDNNDGEQQISHFVRKPMASILSVFLVLLAFILKIVSIIRTKRLPMVAAVLVLLAIVLYYCLK